MCNRRDQMLQTKCYLLHGMLHSVVSGTMGLGILLRYPTTNLSLPADWSISPPQYITDPKW